MSERNKRNFGAAGVSPLPQQTPMAAVRAAAAEAAGRLTRRALVSSSSFFARSEEAAVAAEALDAARLVSEPVLRPLTITSTNPPRHTRVLDLSWHAAAADTAGHRGRVERIARRALAAGRRPVILRGMATELAPVGAGLWSLEKLPTLVPAGRVRVSPDATFRFVRERHPLCVSGAFPLPSRVCEMSGADFVRRITRPPAGGAPLPALHYPDAGPGRERYYLQADVSDEVLHEERVPALWRSILGANAQAQPLRLWCSTKGAVTPLHFDAAHSFLAQMRGTKRLVFFAPRALHGLYPYPADHPLHRRSRVDLYAAAAERDEDFPRFAQEAAAEAQEIELREGDVALFPRHWWHHVVTESALSVSVGCRYV